MILPRVCDGLVPGLRLHFGRRCPDNELEIGVFRLARICWRSRGHSSIFLLSDLARRTSICLSIRSFESWSDVRDASRERNFKTLVEELSIMPVTSRNEWMLQVFWRPRWQDSRASRYFWLWLRRSLMSFRPCTACIRDCHFWKMSCGTVDRKWDWMLLRLSPDSSWVLWYSSIALWNHSSPSVNCSLVGQP